MTFEQIITLLGAITTLLTTGVIAAIKYRKQNKQLKDAEARSATLDAQIKEIEVKEKEREYQDHKMDDLHDSINEMTRHLKELTISNTEKDRIIDDKTAQIRSINNCKSELQEKLIEREAYIGRLKVYIQWLKQWQCKRETGKGKAQCTRRIPMQLIPTPFVEFPDKALVGELGEVEIVEEDKDEEDVKLLE